MDPRFVTVEIKGSSAKLIGLGVMGIGMTALCAGIGYVAFHSVEHTPYDQYARLGIIAVGIFGTLFFGWTTQIAIARFLSAGKTMVTLNRQGIHDKRVSERPIPWESIEDVGVWEMSGQKIIVLSVPPEVEASIGVSAVTRWTRSANKSLGADGLSITAAGLDMGHDALLSAITDRIHAAQGAH